MKTFLGLTLATVLFVGGIFLSILFPKAFAFWGLFALIYPIGWVVRYVTGVDLLNLTPAVGPAKRVSGKP